MTPLAAPAAVLLGSLLLFLVQPLAARALLPVYGGTPAVWTTCMLFFQSGLVAGYAWAHVAARHRRGVRLHELVLAASLLVLGIGALRNGAPLVPGPQPASSDAPQWDLLVRLTVALGLPYLAVSTTGPLVQAWWARAHSGRSPYRLYALSNLGSLLGLLCYPLVVEPLFGLRAQGMLWAGLYASYVVTMVLTGRGLTRPAPAGPSIPAPAEASGPVPAEASGPPQSVDGGIRRAAVWFTLSLVGSALLLAVTNQLCLDVASIPLLWVAPLAIYLVTLIIVFDRPSWYRRATFLPLGLAGVALGGHLFSHVNIGLWLQIPGSLAVLASGCMVAHGELARLRPPPALLTRYYLWISAGGAAGGLAVAVVAPRVFSAYYETHVALIAVAAVCTIAIYDSNLPLGLRRYALPLVLPVLFLAPLVHVGTALRDARRQRPLERARNFFGVVRVSDWYEGDPARHRRALTHGSTWHGFQLLDGARRRTPTTYYGVSSGVGQVLLRHPRRRSGLRIGALGMGVGTMAAWVRAEDSIHFYEIDPEVVRLAGLGPEPLFTFAQDTRGRVEITVGDARRSLEEAGRLPTPPVFDVIVADAFSSDAIPAHLLTREAFAVYLSRLDPVEGVLALHLTNRHLDLAPLVGATARSVGLECRLVASAPTADLGATEWHSRWALCGRAAALDAYPGESLRADGATVCTDDHCALVPRIKLGL